MRSRVHLLEVSYPPQFSLSSGIVCSELLSMISLKWCLAFMQLLSLQSARLVTSNNWKWLYLLFFYVSLIYYFQLLLFSMILAIYNLVWFAKLCTLLIHHNIYTFQLTSNVLFLFSALFLVPSCLVNCSIFTIKVSSRMANLPSLQGVPIQGAFVPRKIIKPL